MDEDSNPRGGISSARFAGAGGGSTAAVVEINGSGFAVTSRRDVESRPIDSGKIGDAYPCSQLDEKNANFIKAALRHGPLKNRVVQVRVKIKRGRTGGETKFTNWFDVSPAG